MGAKIKLHSSESFRIKTLTFLSFFRPFIRDSNQIQPRAEFGLTFSGWVLA